MNHKYDKLNKILHEKMNYTTGVTLFVLTTIVIYLSVIMIKFSKLIKKAKPLPGLAKRIRQIEPMMSWDIFLLDSKDKLSVFAMGKQSIFISEKALTTFDEEELVALILHAIYLNNHQNEFKNMVGTGALITSMMSLSFMVFDSLSLKTLRPFRTFDSVYIVLIILVSYAGLQIMRRDRFKADSYTTRKGYGKALIRAFKKIIQEEKEAHLKCKGPACKISKSISSLAKTYPDIDERIESAKNEVKVQSDIKKLAVDVVSETFKDIAKDQAKDLASKAFNHAIRKARF